MGYEAKKTEHVGPKKGNGAYWGRKRDAKEESNRVRRETGKQEALLESEALDMEQALEDPGRRS